MAVLSISEARPGFAGVIAQRCLDPLQTSRPRVFVRSDGTARGEIKHATGDWMMARAGLVLANGVGFRFQARR